MRTIVLHTRWPAEQVGEQTIEIHVPEHAEGAAIISPQFATQQRLSDVELDAAEFAVLRAIAIMPS